MQIIKEKYEIDETLGKRVKNMLMFLNLRGKLEDCRVSTEDQAREGYSLPEQQEKLYLL